MYYHDSLLFILTVYVVQWSQKGQSSDIWWTRRVWRYL